MRGTTLGRLIGELDEPVAEASPAAASDGNLQWLLARLAQGWRAEAAVYLPDGLDGIDAMVFVTVGRGGQRERIPLTLDRGVRAVIRQRLDNVPVVPAGDPRRAAESESAADPSRELAALFRRTSKLTSEERAARLMDWVMERIDASRCALVPLEGGNQALPLAFHLRGSAPGVLDPRHVPRGIVDQVARTRQPVASGDVGATAPWPGSEATAVRQKVQSYMAVPVVFRGDLLAVCYVDRLVGGQRFDGRERALFEALAYELSRPLLELRDQRRRRDFLAYRDSLLEGREDGPQLVTSPAFDRVLERARRLAPHVDQSLLLLGETGVGKERVARVVHEASGRGARPFVAVNLGALPPDLMESELMGSVRGAFTGAVNRGGRIQQAEGGTLFLDEVGDLPLAKQVLLLRFLQDKRYAPVGGGDDRVADVHVVAATNRPLQELLASGDFRADLFHRFATPLRVPPLRERREEIRPLVRLEIRMRARQAGMPRPEVTPQAMALLEEHPWPGNVRQLQAVIAQAVLLAENGRIGRPLVATLLPQAEEIALAATPPRSWDDYRRWRSRAERAWLAANVEPSEPNLSAVARRLGCPLSTLRSMLRRHGLLDG